MAERHAGKSVIGKTVSDLRSLIPIQVQILSSDSGNWKAESWINKIVVQYHN